MVNAIYFHKLQKQRMECKSLNMWYINSTLSIMNNSRNGMVNAQNVAACLQLQIHCDSLSAEIKHNTLKKAH